MRSGRFYRKNEARVMRDLGLTPTKGSGAGWIEKEDGQSEDLIAQLKSTDSDSVQVKLLDLHKLEYNASVAHKLPVFVVQFLKTEEVFVMVKLEHICEVADIFADGGVSNKSASRVEPEIDVSPVVEKQEQPRIASGGKSRQRFWEKEQEKWQSKKRR